MSVCSSVRIWLIAWAPTEAATPVEVVVAVLGVPGASVRPEMKALPDVVR